MALGAVNFIQKLHCRFYSSYEIPERYRNSFYLANAALFDSVNWFLHTGYATCFPNLVNKLLDKQPKLSEDEATNKIENIIHILEQCNSIIDVRFPIKKENGSYEVIRGFRAQHGLASGYSPCLGGLRINENITRDQMKGLCALSTYKHACMGINLAGAHGGLKINPSNYTQNELKTIVENYARELYLKGYCDGNSDILEPDINTSSLEMSWIASSYSKKSGRNDMTSNNAAVGKPKSLGGIDNYEKLASQGVFFALDYFANNEKVMEEINLSKGLKGKTFIIQGLGKMGAPLANYLEHAGAVCVGVRERDAYLYDFSGINTQAIIDHKNKYGSIKTFGQVKYEQADYLFKEECDILILAAHHKSLVCYVARDVKAKIIVEAANCAITPTAHKILVGHSKLILPDLYVSSGSSVASYLEYLLNRKQLENKQIDCGRSIYSNVLNALHMAEVPQQIVLCSTTQKITSCAMDPNILTYATEFVMTETANEILNIAKEYKLGLDLRTAAYVNAIQKIFNSVLNKY